MTRRLLWEQELYLPEDRKSELRKAELRKDKGSEAPKPALQRTNLLAVVLREFNRRKR